MGLIGVSNSSTGLSGAPGFEVAGGADFEAVDVVEATVERCELGVLAGPPAHGFAGRAGELVDELIKAGDDLGVDLFEPHEAVELPGGEDAFDGVFEGAEDGGDAGLDRGVLFGGEAVLAGVQAVLAGIAGDPFLTGLGAGPCGFEGVGAVGSEATGCDADEGHGG